LSISATTRAARPDEVDGVNYHFLDDVSFDAQIAAGGFLEWAHVHGARYGTLKEAVERDLEHGKTVILEIDVQGARSVRTARPEALLVFVQPPDQAVLESRLRGRGTEDEEAVRVRLRNASEEMAAASDFDEILLNDDLQNAVAGLIRILDAHVAPTRGPSQE